MVPDRVEPEVRVLNPRAAVMVEPFCRTKVPERRCRSRCGKGISILFVSRVLWMA
jgi:hypothetical protein